ncbi:uncharacterized protein LOC122400137 [Colletes gigas]|uniref:uncharacterized protein LOC122400137 n=1 Tax=Colletes gigas TaxID=935657 RepID=UPI001C9B3D24|nr:uncharacterized protein LOC122400137 [Colletes gigas]
MALEAPSWLNVDFTERILRLTGDDNNVQVNDIFIKPATNKGDNYVSDMMRVVVDFTHFEGDKKLDGKKSLLFKFEPLEEGPRKEFIHQAQVFDTEILMMTDTLKKMNDLLSSGPRLSARILHVRLERPLCLIIEDLAPFGFRMADRQAGMDLTHSMMAIQGIARFHASSIALYEKEPKQKEMYKKGMFRADYSKEALDMFSGMCNTLAHEVDSWPELTKEYGAKLRALAPHIHTLGLKMTEQRNDELNVINHGDAWANNMLFRYDNNSKPVEHIFVDFQLCLYCSPAIDLHYFLSTSLSIDVYDNKRDVLMNEYLRTLCSTMKQLGCKTEPPTMDQLKKTMRERETYAFIASIFVLPVVLVDKNQVKTIDEMTPNENGIIDTPAVRNPLYKKIMLKRLVRFMELGILEVPT